MELSQIWSKAKDQIIAALYPPKCSLCDRIGTPPICDDCLRGFAVADASNLKAELPGVHVAHAVYGYSGRSGQAVRRLKYDRATALGEPMSHLLFIEAESKRMLDVDGVVPVPVSDRRRRERGFNQSELLVEAFPDDLVRVDLLSRIRHTKPQVKLKMDERLRNLEGAFSASSDVRGMRILLVDDVITTGGTAAACSSELMRAGAADVSFLAFCGESGV